MNRYTLAAILAVFFLALSGCGRQAGAPQPEDPGEGTVQENPVQELPGPSGEQESDRRPDSKPEEIAETYRDIYESAAGSNTLGSLETVTRIVERLGDNGYCATDTENKNQVNMTHPEQMERFCGRVEDQLDGEASFISVMDNGGFIHFGLSASDGGVNVRRSVVNWENGNPRVSYENSYEAYRWEYDEGGYLFFEEYRPPGYDGAPGYTAVRVKPLNEMCRRQNSRYLLPVGYGSNNMFIADWSEEDFGELNFYDLFDILYPSVFHRPNPYEKTPDGKVYLVPEAEFEKVILSYFEIDLETLRSETKYLAGEHTYEYRTRGFADGSFSPGTPYPETVACTENADGTVTLTVNTVWPKEFLSRAFCHEVVVRPLQDGSFRYVSNRVAADFQGTEPAWYVEKYTDEEWEALRACGS